VDAGGRDEQRDGERQQPHAGVDRRKPERHGEEERDDEEHAGSDEVLEEEHLQAADHLFVAQQRGPDERLRAALHGNVAQALDAERSADRDRLA
jgi:hypothetical protein